MLGLDRSLAESTIHCLYFLMSAQVGLFLVFVSKYPSLKNRRGVSTSSSKSFSLKTVGQILFAFEFMAESANRCLVDQRRSKVVPTQTLLAKYLSS